MTDKPTDEELKAMWQLHAADIGGIFDFARAVLAKWGTPAPKTNQCGEIARASLAASAGSEPVANNQPSLESVFRGISDRAYCDYIEQMRRNECLGWEHKVKHGLFGESELKAHTLAGRLLGRHHAFAEAANALRTHQPSTTAPADSQPTPDEIINMAREQGLPETETEGVFIVNVDDLGRVFAAYRAARAPADSVLEDAARYRLVRRGQHWSVIDGIGNELRAELLDASVDEARKQGGAT